LPRVSYKNVILSLAQWTVKMDELKKMVENKEQKSEKLQPLANTILQHQTEHRLQISINDLLCSYIHMMINRLFRTQQRKHELVLYDYLFRYYDAIIRRKNDEIKRERRKEF
jgi:thiopeptide-type bacteriocin biosynthesis protein